jgi:hypothetical protein
MWSASFLSPCSALPANHSTALSGSITSAAYCSGGGQGGWGGWRERAAAVRQRQGRRGAPRAPRCVLPAPFVPPALIAGQRAAQRGASSPPIQHAGPGGARPPAHLRARQLLVVFQRQAHQVPLGQPHGVADHDRAADLVRLGLQALQREGRPGRRLVLRRPARRRAVSRVRLRAQAVRLLVGRGSAGAAWCLTLEAAASASCSVLSSTCAVLGSHAAACRRRGRCVVGPPLPAAQLLWRAARAPMSAEQGSAAGRARAGWGARARTPTVAGAPPRGVHVVVRPLFDRVLAVLVDALPVRVLGGAVLCELLPLQPEPVDAVSQVVHVSQLSDRVLDQRLRRYLEQELVLLGPLWLAARGVSGQRGQRHARERCAGQRRAAPSCATGPSCQSLIRSGSV